MKVVPSENPVPNLVNCVAAEDWRRIGERYQVLRSGHLAPGSLASYNSGVNAFLQFKTLAREYIPVHPIFPISDETLGYFASFEGQFVAPDSVKQYIYGIKAWQKWNGHKFPPLKERPSLFEAMQGKG